MTQLPSSGGKFDFVRSAQTYESPEQMRLDERYNEQGFVGNAIDYAGEVVTGLGEAVGDQLANLIPSIQGQAYDTATYAVKRAGKAFGLDVPEEAARLGANALSTMSGIPFGQKTSAELGRELQMREDLRPPSQFTGKVYFEPQEISSVAQSVLGGIAAIAFPPLAVPATTLMATQAYTAVMGDYQKYLGESGDEYDPMIASALMALVGVETIGSKAVMIDLPKYLGKKAGLDAFKNILRAGSSGARKSAIEKAIKSGALQVGALAVQGGEELVEEGLESAARIMYREEFDTLRESILNGDVGTKEFEQVWGIVSEGGLKPFYLGALGGGAVNTFSTLKGPDAASRAARDTDIAREVAAEAAAARRAASEPETVIAEQPVEDITADEVVEPQAEVTVSDIDSDQWAAQLYAENPEAVDNLILTPTTKKVKAQAPGRNPFKSVLPPGMVTDRSQRQALFERLVAAREAALQPAEAATEGDIDVAPPVAPMESVVAPEPDENSDEANLTRARNQLLEEMDGLDPDSDEYMELEQQLGMNEAEMDRQGIEFSRNLSGPIESSRLDVEPGSQRGSARGGFATDRRTGRRMYTKRYPNSEQSSNEVIASKLYGAAGVNAPQAETVVENGEVVGVATEVVEGLTRGTPRDAADGLVIDAWLGNWDVVGMDQDNLLVGRNGEAVRIDQGGALTTRAQGAPKGEAFGDNVGELTTLVEQNPELQPTAEQLRRGFNSLRSLSDQQIRDIVTENGGDASLVRTLIRRKRDLLAQEEQAISDQELSQEGAEFSRNLDTANKANGTDFVPLTEEETKTLTDGQREIAENARKRLGRNVVFVTSPSGNNDYNGWIQGRDSNTIYIIVQPNINEAIAKVAKNRGMRERLVREAYENTMLQTVLHENVHLTEDRLEGTELDIKSDAQSLLEHILSVRGNNERLAGLQERFDAGLMTEEEFQSEQRAESLSDFLALSQSGIDTLFMNRGRVRNTLGRIRRIANRLGGSKDVRTISRVVKNMERGNGFVPSNPDVNTPPVEQSVEFSRRFPLAESWYDGSFDIEVAKANPSPKNLAVLMATREIIKSKTPAINTIIKRLAPIGFEIDTETAAEIKEIYSDISTYYTNTSQGRMTEMRGEQEQFGPAGVVERKMGKLFDSNPSPTAEQLAKMPGSPKPTTNDMVVKMATSKKNPWTQVRADSFVKRAKDTVLRAEGNVVETKDERLIDKLMKENDVVIFTGDGGPVIHAKRTWTDRFAAPVDYSVIKEVTVEAAERGHHNWYRDFGKFFKSLGGTRLINEAAMLFGVTSSQSAVENNISDTLHLMRLVREHKRDGKPWNKESLKDTLWPYLLKNGKKYKKKSTDADFARGSRIRRNKFTESGEAAMFISEKQIDTIIDFYIDGTPVGGAIKTRTYSGAIAEAAMNMYYPFSVQDRHQAATYGFFHGKFNSGNGNFTFDKIFNNETGFRYAAYLTQRLSMEPELLGLTPNQIQAAQWFYTKAGEGPYEVEAKTDKGLIANFARDNPDLTTGTLDSALRFAEFEIADLTNLMSTLPDDAAYPAPDLEVPVYEKTLNGHYDYVGGQAVAREFGEVMELEAPRVMMMMTPNMSLPGLALPSENMTETAATEMTTSILQSVTETDGTVRLFNDMGIPHTPLTAGPTTSDGLTGNQFAVIPMLGSITSDSTAKLLGATLGFGMMQPRVHVSRFTPEGAAATIRLKTQSGSPLTPSTVASVKLPAVKGSEVIQITSAPESDYVDVVISPSSGSVSDSQIESAFTTLSKELNDAGIPVEGQVLRTEITEIQQDEYRGIIEGSGLDVSAEGQSGILGRVLSEITSPTLSNLQASGYSFNRDEFQNQTGLSREQVSDLPAEFSRNFPAMSLAEKTRLKDVKSSNFGVRNIGEFNEANPADQQAQEFAQWWTSLEFDEKSAVNFWMLGNATPNNLSEDMNYSFEIDQISTMEPSVMLKGGHEVIRVAALSADGSRGWSSAHGMQSLLRQGGKIKDPNIEKVMEETVAALDSAVEQTFERLDAIGLKRNDAFQGTAGFMQSGDSYFITFSGGGEIRVNDYGKVLENMGSDLLEAMSDEEFAVVKKMDNWNSNYTNETIADAINKYKSAEAIWNSAVDKELNKLNTVDSEFFRYLDKIHNTLIGAISKAAVVEGTIYRNTNAITGEGFEDRFNEGDLFRTNSPASASRSKGIAGSFGGYSSGSTVFTIESKTSRTIGAEDYVATRIFQSSPDPDDIDFRSDEVTIFRRDVVRDQQIERYLLENGFPIEVNEDSTMKYDDASEQEVLSMPGTVYRVKSISGIGMGNQEIILEEVGMSADEAANVPVLPEFSRNLSNPVAPMLTVPTDKQLELQKNLAFRTKGVRRQLQDRFIELDYLQRDIIEAYGPLDIDTDPLNRFRNMPGRVADKAGRFADRVMKPLMKGVAKQKITLAQLGEYAAAKHALDANADLRARNILGMTTAQSAEVDSGLSDEVAKQIIARYEAMPNFKKIEALRINLVSIGKQNLRLAHRNGLISTAEYDTLRDRFPNYVPFWNAFNEETEQANATREQFLVPSNIFKARTGRETNSLVGDNEFFADRIAAMADQRYRIIRKSEQNVALQRLFRLAEMIDRPDLMGRYEVPMTQSVDKKGNTILVPSQEWMSDPTVFKVMVNGEAQLLQINHPPLAEAIRDKRAEQNVIVRNIMGTFSTYTSLKRFFSTQFGNPDFTITNPIRDIQTSGASMLGDYRQLTKAKSGEIQKLSMVDRLRIVMASTKNLFGSWVTILTGGGNEQTRRQYEQYKLLGARQEFFDVQDPAKSRKQLQKIVRSATNSETRTLGGKAVRIALVSPKKIVDAWQHVNTMFDDGVRFATYRSLIKEGVLPEKAVEITRDLTVDFSKTGTSGRTINSMYAFANASAQGSTKTLRLLKTKAGASVFGAYFITGMMSEIWNDDEEDRDGNLKNDWDEIPDWEKDSSMFIRVKDDDGEVSYIKVPVAYGLAIPYVAGRRMMKWLRGKETMMDGMLATAAATYSNLNPLGGEVIATDSAKGATSSALRLLAPDIIDPTISLATNRDWLNNSIYNEPFPTDPSPVPSTMGRDGTDEWAKSLAGFVNELTGGDDVRAGAVSFQPEFATYMVGDIFSGAWRTADRVGTMLQNKWREANYPGEDLSETTEIPGLRRFFTTSPRERDTISDYYEYRDIAQAAEADIKEYGERGDTDKMDSLVDSTVAERTPKAFYKKIKELQKIKRDSIGLMKKEGASNIDMIKERKYWDGIIKPMQADAVKLTREIKADG